MLIADHTPHWILHDESPPTVRPTITYAPIEPVSHRRHRGLAWLVAGGAAFLGLLVVLLGQQIGLLPQMARYSAIAKSEVRLEQNAVAPTPTTDLPDLSQAATVRPPTMPLPRVYGVYALSGGELSELEALPGRVPDQTVFMSTLIKTPSRTMLPDGKVVFVVYRRDFAANAPDRVTVRVIAKVMRAMTFSATAKVNTVNVDDQWSVRSTSYELRVAPLPESPEMLVIRPQNSDFALAAGRYGLVLKGQAYDFTVAGPITDTVQCLERVEAENGSFYSECRKP